MPPALMKDMNTSGACRRFREVSVVDDKSKGLVLEVTLEPGASQDDARRVLGRFPFTLA